MCAFYRDETGHMVVDGLSLDTIAADYGSPLYVYSGAGIVSAYNDFAAAVAPVNGKVHFAVKANSALGVIALLGKQGAGADIVSSGEMERVIAAGIAPADIVFSGVGKSESEIAAALGAGVGQINAESPVEIDMISAVAANMGIVAPVALRVNVDVDPGTHEKISTGQRSTKFGVSTGQREAADLYRRICEDTFIAPAGLAVHIGSQITNLEPFETAYKALLNLANGLRGEGLAVPTLDLGGGVGVDYDNGTPTDFTAYGKMLPGIFKDSGFALGFEPGRSIVANNGVLLTRVILVKEGDDKRFAIVDAAMNDLIRPTLYESYHNIQPVAPLGENIGIADIVGPVCETGDYLGRERQMPALAGGDCLVVMSAGAYGAVMASSYNTRPPAGEVIVLDGKVHVLRAQRSVASLLAEENIPTF
ncbi:diaminopimelate decarboxylase [Alphaproteobacteria bacterium]|nr:diaminopimelate decarboxylase [Alphaproteobacteria bacterium]